MNRLFKAVVVGALTVFSAVVIMGCGAAEEDKNDYRKLNGVWDRGDIAVTFNNSSGVFSRIDSNSGWRGVMDNGDIAIGSVRFKDIESTTDSKWTAQRLTYNTSTFRVSSWAICQIELRNDGKTITVVGPNSGEEVYTKQ